LKYVSIGHTQRTHGLKGELKVHVETAFLEDFLKCERLFLDIKGTKVPYFIEDLRGSDPFILKLEEVDNRDAAFALQSREIFLRDKDILSEAAREMPLPEGLRYARLKGYQIIDLHLGPLGIIDEVLDMPQQEMAVIHRQGEMVLIPLNEQFVQSIDEKARTVTMDLPEGLV